MKRGSILALGMIVAWAGPALAEPNTVHTLQSLSRFAGEPPADVDRRGLSFPVIEYSDADGVVRQRKGIIAGQEVAPGTVVGLGFFETAPKARGYVGDIPSTAPKRTRRAAVGVSWKF